MKIVALILFILLTQVLYAFETSNQNLIELQQEPNQEYKYEGLRKISLLVFGLFFAILSITYLWYTEKNEAIIEHRLQITFDNCESVSCEDINPLNDGRLIHINGKTESNDVIHDPDFGLTLNRCIRLYRQVEMLQWVKRSTEQGDRDYYHQEWDSVYHDSENYCFGYVNNKNLWYVQKKVFLNPQVNIGAFELSESLKQQVMSYQTVQISKENIEQAKQTYAHSNCIIYACGEYIMFQQTDGILKVGDLRVKFFEFPLGEFTVLSQQQSNSFTPWKFRQENGDSYLCCCVNVDNQDNYVDRLLKHKLTKFDAYQTLLNEYQGNTCCQMFGFHFLISLGMCFLLFPQSGQEYTSDHINLFFIACLLVCVPVTLFIIGLAWICYIPKKGFKYIIFSLSFIGIFYLMVFAKPK